MLLFPESPDHSLHRWQTDIISSPETRPAAATFITAELTHTSNNRGHWPVHHTHTHTSLTATYLTHISMLAQFYTHNCTHCQHVLSSHQHVSHFKGIVSPTPPWPADQNNHIISKLRSNIKMTGWGCAVIPSVKDLHVCDAFNIFSSLIQPSIITQHVQADLKLIYSLTLAGGFCLGCLKWCEAVFVYEWMDTETDIGVYVCVCVCACLEVRPSNACRLDNICALRPKRGDCLMQMRPRWLWHVIQHAGHVTRDQDAAVTVDSLLFFF